MEEWRQCMTEAMEKWKSGGVEWRQWSVEGRVEEWMNGMETMEEWRQRKSGGSGRVQAVMYIHTYNIII